MRHRKRRSKLGKPADQRKALIKSLLIALIKNEKIKTTNVRGKELSRAVEKLITLGKKQDIASRREAFRYLQDRTLVQKLFNDIAPRFNGINGGYTRVIKVGKRHGDNALVSIVEFTKIKEEIIEEKKKNRFKRLEKKRKMAEEQLAPEVEEVKVEEEKIKKEAVSEKTKEKKKIRKEKKEKEPVLKKDTTDKEEDKKKGFFDGLKGFLKGKK